MSEFYVNCMNKSHVSVNVNTESETTQNCIEITNLQIASES